MLILFIYTVNAVQPHTRSHPARLCLPAAPSNRLFGSNPCARHGPRCPWSATATASNGNAAHGSATLTAYAPDSNRRWTTGSSKPVPCRTSMPWAPPIPRPRIVFDLRGATAGMAVTERTGAHRVKQWIRIHPQLLLRYPVRMIQQTIPHEVAHLVVDWYLPRVTDPHGPEWMAVMVYFGRPPLPYHDMESIRRR